MKRMNKKGAEMTIGTIIAITLGVALLVFLIYGFSTGWKGFQERISQIGGTDSNVDAVTSGCEVACVSNSKDAYCNQVRTIRFGKDADLKEDKGNCTFFVEKGYISVSCDIC